MFKPILLISEVFFWQTEQAGIHAKVIGAVAPHGFYRGVETKVVHDAQERKALRQACAAHGLTLMQWLTKTLVEQNLNLSSLDSDERRKAVACAKECIDLAAECGAFAVGLISGADAGPEKRPEALRGMDESFMEIAEYLNRYDMGLIFEALDRETHKRQLMGPTTEAAAFIESLKRVNPRCGMCWDSAHVALLGEDFGQSLTEAAGVVLQLHLSNAVLDKQNGFHGDHHFPMEVLGFMTAEKTAEILRAAAAAGAVGDGRVGVEVRTLPGNDPWVTEQNCRDFLGRVLARLTQ